MKKHIISLVLLVSILFSFCFTTYAVESNIDSLESMVADRIEQMVSLYYFDYPGRYEIGNAIAIYNADTVSTYYIIPVFCNQECLVTVEVDVNGNVTLSDEVTLYTEITELGEATYLLYTSGGVVYAEISSEVIELYDSGFSIPVNNSFMCLSYVDKAAQAEVCLETTAANLNISAVVSQTELMSATGRQVSTFGAIPRMEIEECAITNFVTQDNYNICWAACVATIANFKNGTSLTAQAVATRMGHNYTHVDYEGATSEQTITALSLYGLTYTCETEKLAWSDVKSNITDDCPFILGLCSPNYNPETGQIEVWGHMVTGYGYNCRAGDSAAYENLRNVQVWDPNGAHYTFAYYASSYSLYGYTWYWEITLVD